MANIKPFRGVVYNAKAVGNLSKVVAPPYDIISKARQNELYKISPYNLIRLELGKIKGSDSRSENRYTRARKHFDSWLKNKQMVRDDKESIYVYSQKYRSGGRVMERIGFIALMGLDEGKKKVLPHENTLHAPKVDRLDLMRCVKSNLSPIFILYEDPRHAILNILKKVCLKKPFIDIPFEGIRNRAWRLDDKSDIKKIQAVMRNASTFIADGHHRFEVAKMYAKEIARTKAPSDVKESAKHVMVYFVESNEDMLTVLPAHRLPKDIGGLNIDGIMGRLHKYFTIESLQSLNSMMARLDRLQDAHVFGLYLGRKRYYILKLKSFSPVDKAIRDKPEEWKRLDVAILHLFIFQHVLGIRDEDDNVEFVKSPQDTAGLVDKGDFKAAFFLNPTKVSEVKRIARIGEKMPRKATYFFPKQISGIVINKLG